METQSSIRGGIEVDEFGRKLIHEQDLFLFSVVLFTRLTLCITPGQIVVDMQRHLKMIRCISLFVR